MSVGWLAVVSYFLQDPLRSTIRSSHRIYSDLPSKPFNSNASKSKNSMSMGASHGRRIEMSEIVVGDLIRFSTELLELIDFSPDRHSQLVRIKEIRLETDGTKTLFVSNDLLSETT